MLNGLLLCFCCASAAHEMQTAADHADQVMRGIGIQYLISDDRKLPKSDRQKWEADLAEWIDFAALNEGMRERIRTAMKEAKAENHEPSPAEITLIAARKNRGSTSAPVPAKAAVTADVPKISVGT